MDKFPLRKCTKKNCLLFCVCLSVYYQNEFIKSPNFCDLQYKYTRHGLGQIKGILYNIITGPSAFATSREGHGTAHLDHVSAK